MRSLRLLSLALALMLASGCASVLAKTHQRVQLQSDVEGTQVTVEEQDSDLVYGPQYTPAWVVLDKSKDYVIRFRSPEGTEIEFTPGRDVDLLTLLNLFGLLGFVADLYTGAFFRFQAYAWRADFDAKRVHQSKPDRSLPHLELPRYTPRRGSASRQATEQ